MEIRRLIREMSLANRLWGAPRIHGELLKLGIEVAQSPVAKYMVRSGRGRSQTWKTFLHNHAAGIATMDFLVVPTVGFKLLFVLVILRHQRRRLLSLSVTASPTAEWIARQITDAFPWNEAHDYVIRDRDGSYGHAATRHLAAMGIRDHPTAARSPLQNGHAERLIGSIRRECLDHIVVFGEAHLRRILRAYGDYYNNIRMHLALAEDLPLLRPIQRFGEFAARPVLGGLHHQYCRILFSVGTVLEIGARAVVAVGEAADAIVEGERLVVGVSGHVRYRSRSWYRPGPARYRGQGSPAAAMPAWARNSHSRHEICRVGSGRRGLTNSRLLSVQSG
jgi:transposase InsO family protein